MTRICPSCNNPIEYKTYRVFWKATKHNSTCRPCFYKSMNGHRHSEETRRKIGDANKISLLGNPSPNKGVPLSEEHKKKLSVLHTGKTFSEATKQKHRIRCLKKRLDDGIPLNEDRGAKQFFCEWNLKHNTQFVPLAFREIGYIADGYDKSQHIWIEFDPPHHYYVTGVLKPKDMIRQTNIIRHFESIGTPLKEFVRVQSDKQGNVLSTKCVYKGGI